MFHIYLIFFLSLLGTLLAAGVLFFSMITMKKPDGTAVRTDWPVTFAESFREQIYVSDNSPGVRQAGIGLLKENEIGLQILDAAGFELYSFQKPAHAESSYSMSRLVELCQPEERSEDGMVRFIKTVSFGEEEFIYILYFPARLSRVTMYLNGEHFAGGKTILLPVAALLVFLISVSGMVYGFRTAGTLRRLTAAIQDISSRSYLPVTEHGTFFDVYDSLNTLNTEIRESDRLRARTEQMRKEWIANITHDLKTPLSPIKGYAELLLQEDKSFEECRKYAGIMLKNAAYMETLIEDLKLTYQLSNGMLPLNRQQQDAVRFLRELVIDILNMPEYENRVIHFDSPIETLSYPFDTTLFTRAFRNLVLNAFIHGTPDTEVWLQVSSADTEFRIWLADNGNGMTAAERERLFDRYYRGEATRQKPEGSGLGLAIAKEIIELHGGQISVDTIPGTGTTFYIRFPLC